MKQLSSFCLLAWLMPVAALWAQVNLAQLAQPSTSFVSGHESLAAISNDFEPGDVGDHRHGAYGNWPRTGSQWVQYDWSRPISTRRVEVYWWTDGQGVRLPKACRLLYWDGKALMPVPAGAGFGVLGGQWNATTFDEVNTPKLRLEFDGNEQFSTGIIEWKVFDSGKSPEFPPTMVAGVDRVVVIGRGGWPDDSRRSGAAAQYLKTLAQLSVSGEARSR